MIYLKKKGFDGLKADKLIIDEAVNQQAVDKALSGMTSLSKKPNQKQFKEFNESLFESYISKFNYIDKCKALVILNQKIKEDVRKM